MSTDKSRAVDDVHRRTRLDTTSERGRESLALVAGAVAFVVTALAALLVFRLAPTSIAGPGSIGQFSAIAAAIIAIAAFVTGRLLLGRKHGRWSALDVLDLAALSLAHAVVALLSWTLLAVILERGFIDAPVFGVPGVVLAGSVAAVTAYVALYSATHMDLQLLAVVLAVFLVEGVIASTLTASDPFWWKENLSALGMTNDLSALAFNLTIIVAGILVTTLARYATGGIRSTHPRGISRVRLCLILVGVFLGFVGVFPVDRFFAIHTGFASGMVVVFGVLVIRIGRWMPGTPRPFATLGVVLLAVIVVLAVLFAVGYYTLTAVELVAGILVFTWVILFIRNASALAQDS